MSPISGINVGQFRPATTNLDTVAQTQQKKASRTDRTKEAQQTALQNAAASQTPARPVMDRYTSGDTRASAGEYRVGQDESGNRAVRVDPVRDPNAPEGRNNGNPLQRAEAAQGNQEAASLQGANNTETDEQSAQQVNKAEQQAEQAAQQAEMAANRAEQAAQQAERAAQNDRNQSTQQANNVAMTEKAAQQAGNAAKNDNVSQQIGKDAQQVGRAATDDETARQTGNVTADKPAQQTGDAQTDDQAAQKIGKTDKSDKADKTNKDNNTNDANKTDKDKKTDKTEKDEKAEKAKKAEELKKKRTAAAKKIKLEIQRLKQDLIHTNNPKTAEQLNIQLLQMNAKLRQVNPAESVSLAFK